MQSLTVAVCESGNDQKDTEFVHTPEQKNIENMFFLLLWRPSQNVKKKGNNGII